MTAIFATYTGLLAGALLIWLAATCAVAGIGARRLWVAAAKRLSRARGADRALLARR